MKKGLVLLLTALSVGTTVAVVAAAKVRKENGGTVLELSSKDGSTSLTAWFGKTAAARAAGLDAEDDEGRRVVARAKRVSLSPEEIEAVI